MEDESKIGNDTEKSEKSITEKNTSKGHISKAAIEEVKETESLDIPPEKEHPSNPNIGNNYFMESSDESDEFEPPSNIRPDLKKSVALPKLSMNKAKVFLQGLYG